MDHMGTDNPHIANKWYVGSMNDACFIIDGPPTPGPYDGPIPKTYGPNAICGALPEKTAQKIVDAHNVALEQ